VNEERSTLARRAGVMLPMLAGGQTTVSTKTYTCCVAALMYLAFALARKPARGLTQALSHAIEAEERIIERHDVLLPPAVEFFDFPPYVLLLARGADLASAYQGALMLKEVVRLAAEPMSAAQFRHGPIEIIDPKHRYVIFARQGKTAELLLKLAIDIRRHGGRVLLITDLGFKDFTQLKLVPVETLPLGLGTLVDSLHIQLLAHDLALRAGLEPGKFRIATDVTREE
jgi:glucosamine--fructose-6-phosphate aminotransferase (isomerizing)